MEKSKSNGTFVIGIAFTLIFFTVISLLFPSIYVLDDDVMIQSILSGTYLRPYPYTYYFSAELGFVLSLFYRVAPSVAWLGLFFAAVYICSFLLLLMRVMRMGDTPGRKCIYAGCAILVFLGMFFGNYIMLHYTVVSATAVFCGLFMMITSKEKRDMIAAAVMFMLSYLIRENVFFMSIPFMGLAGLYLLFAGRKDFLKKYGKILFISVLVFALLFIINRCLPAGENWREYKEYNELRTSVYDYGVIDTTGTESLNYYEANGLSGEDVLLYKTYDLILPMALSTNSSTDYMKESATVLEKLKGYNEYNNQGNTVSRRIKDAVYTYIFYMLKYETMRYYHYFLMALYIVFAVVSLVCKRPGFLVTLPAVLAVRSFLWIALAYMGRYPDRVLVSSLLMEAAVILGMIFKISEKKKLKPVFSGIIMTVFAVATLFSLRSSVTDYREESDRIFADDPVYEHIKENKDSFYLLDVYSVVNHSIYAIKDYDPSYENYMLLGGWITGHPLMKEKINNLPDELYIIDRDDYKENNYILEDASNIRLIPVDEIEDKYTVYRITEQ